MRKLSIALGAALCVGGCTTNTTPVSTNLGSESTLKLCRMILTSSDQAFRLKVAELLVKRGANAEKCQRLVASDNSMATGIAISGAAVAAGAVAANNGGYGGYYPSSGAYGVAWDQFYNQYGQPVWQCRDRATGRFVYDYHCAGKPMVDSTWPGWRA